LIWNGDLGCGVQKNSPCLYTVDDATEKSDYEAALSTEIIYPFNGGHPKHPI